MNNNPIKIGVVGCGWIMRSTYTPALLSVAGEIQVVAVCDLNEEAARACAENFTSAKAFTDVDLMLQEAHLDAVMVLTSEKVNMAMAQKVLKAGLPVYLEKPPAVSSSQLEELIAAEARSTAFVYTAFNRRHTPLYAGLNLAGEKLTKISGALRRKNRIVATFPHTSIHVVDSAQYFARSLLKNWKIKFEKKADHSIWMIESKLENGAACSLEFIPDGPEFSEYLVLESANRKWELQFPNTEAAVSEGELIVTSADGSPISRTQGEKSLPAHDAMGFSGSLLEFARAMKEKKASPLHRLASCRATIRMIEEMEAACG